MKFISLYVSLFLFPYLAFTQEEKPKIVIGIVVDQMRYDYLEKFWDDFGDRGFKRLVNEGFNCKNVNYNYKPTYTGPGHASIYTGTTPSVHGIIGNNWYSRDIDEVVYCVSHKNEGGSYNYNPKNLLVNTIADEIRSQTEKKGKAFGISLKDRGAILPAGHTANGAYWFDGKKGEWVSSDYYKSDKPAWLETFNEIDFFDTYLKSGWQLSLSSDSYSESALDLNDFERPYTKGGKVTFPYDLSKLFEVKGWDLLKAVPYGNQMTVDLASKLIQAEQMGKDEDLDFLSISFSATDYIGHQFGVQAIEVQDTYIKLDKTIEDFLSFLDTEIGENKYLLFLTSDHGAAMPRKYLEAKNISCGYINTKKMREGLEANLDDVFGENDWVSSIINYNIFFNDSIVSNLDSQKYDQVMMLSLGFLSQQAGIKNAFLKEKLSKSNNELINLTRRGVNMKLSGEIVLLEERNWTSYTDKGSTHGSPYKYDTHVPLIFYGNHILPGESNIEHVITDIASTVVNLADLFPAEQFQGSIIKEVTKRGKANKTK